MNLLTRKKTQFEIFFFNNPPMKSAIVKGYALNEVLAHCKASDCVFARKVLRGGYQFFAWPGTKHADVARAVLSMPDEIRCVHAVFGRIGTPMDLVVDYDQPYPTVTSIESARQLRNKRLAFLVERLHRAVSDAHETVESTVVLHSPSIKKFSFHVHVRLAGKAFEDYRAVKAFVESSGIAAELPAVDTQIYRPSGMLRMFSCFKEDGTRPLQLVNDVPEIVALGANTAHVTPQVAAEHSLCIREVDAATRLIPVPASAKQPPTSAKYASDGPDIDVDTCVEEADFLTQRLTIEYSDPWKSWIAVGAVPAPYRAVLSLAATKRARSKSETAQCVDSVLQEGAKEIPCRRL